MLQNHTRVYKLPLLFCVAFIKDRKKCKFSLACLVTLLSKIHSEIDKIISVTEIFDRSSDLGQYSYLKKFLVMP